MTNMQLHPWIIASWPIIEHPRDQAPELAADLQHLGTTVSDDCDEYGRLLGHTIWGATRSEVGIAWDWVEAHDGIFALADPMGVVSNIQFTDDAGLCIPEFMSAVQLNRIAHELPWQVEVATATRGFRTTEPWVKRIGASRTVRIRSSDENRWESPPRRSAGPESGLLRS
jgi:hypothetical protein